jgi:beta-glucanase (GH16 family)
LPGGVESEDLVARRLRRRRPLPVLGLALLVGCIGLVTLAPAASAYSGPRNWFTCMFGQCPTTTTTSPSTTTTSTTTSTTEDSTTTTTTTEPVDGDCGTVANPDGGTWHCTFDDEFDGTSLDRTKWSPQLTAKGSFDSNTECFVDTPDNIAVAEGTLKLTVRKEAAPFSCAGVHQSQYTSGMVSTNPNITSPGFGQAYGRWEVRAKMVDGATSYGTQESIWMWPVTKTGQWPYSGEIDIAEVYGRYNDRAIPYIHYDNSSDPDRTNNYCLIDDITKYHTYALDWTPESLRVTYDGTVCIDDHWQPRLPPFGRHPFNAPFFLVLTQLLGVKPNAFNATTTVLPASTVVDYVRVWGD